MNPEQIATWLRRRPFEPFRVHISGGKAYDILHPETVITGTATLVIGIKRGGSATADPPDVFELVSNLHIIRLEPLVPERAA